MIWVMKDRIIFHSDINHCYAQIEEMKYPELRLVPMAVGGHEETRHGIILAKNDLAKAKGVKTGESLREAYEKCPDLLIIPPAYKDYEYYTDAVKDISREYSDHVESFGLDEAWIDYTDSERLFGPAYGTAAEIQKRVLEEIGLTVSIGISWNKIFAKLGSDLIKPSGLVDIRRDNFRKVVWPLPVSELLYVGPATYRKLHRRGILTIGELAQYPVQNLKRYLGVAGEVIHAFANGDDTSPVTHTEHSRQVKSVGNSMTLVHDVYSLEEADPVFYMLSESVASRLRGHGLEGDVVHVSLRTADMNWYGWERKISRRTYVSMEIHDAAIGILRQNYDFHEAVRAVGVSLSHLSAAGSFRQADLFTPFKTYEQALAADLAMDDLRRRFGFDSVKRACTIVDRKLTDFNVKDDHTIHPVGYFQGRKMDVL